MDAPSSLAPACWESLSVNLYDGHTLEECIEQAERVCGVKPQESVHVLGGEAPVGQPVGEQPLGDGLRRLGRKSQTTVAARIYLWYRYL